LNININKESFRSFICLGFDKNDKGQFTDINWFHGIDLTLSSLWGFTKEDVEGWSKQ